MLEDLSCDRDTLVELLSSRDAELREALFSKAAKIRDKYTGKRIFFRGLIEYSNKCSKDCHYCGIRACNLKLTRYEMSRDEVLEAALFAWKNRLGSVVIQSGERSDKAFTSKMTSLLEDIREHTGGELKVTLSCGEQTEEVFRDWMDAGADRYLLRIETSNTGLFSQLHPDDGKHLFKSRLRALETLKKLGYQTGTGVMIGIPGQSMEMLAADLAFFRNFNVDMVGMGPYLETEGSLMDDSVNRFRPAERLELSLRMVALLRILMKDINIAASTALQAIEPSARLAALQCGANVLMPNITPLKYRDSYQLYNNKPGLLMDAAENIKYWEEQLKPTGCVPAWNEHGDPLHYTNKKTRQKNQMYY
jgi:biotin synthase